MKVFLDTNVVLDVLTGRQPFCRDSGRVWTLAESGRVEAMVSALTFANVFYIVGRLKDRAAAREAVVLLRDTFAVVECDAQIIDQAIDSDLSDFEDGIQYFSALRAQADRFVTRNPSDIPAEPTPVQTPAEFLGSLPDIP